MSDAPFTIVTHSGKFHADEVCATAFLELWKGQKAKIVRTRDLETIKELSSSEKCFVVDVGLVYDPDRRRYDHHQDDMDLSFEDIVSPDAPSSMINIPLSSFGLVYSSYGRELLYTLATTGSYAADDIRSLEYDDYERMFKKLYYRMCRDIDAYDNGISYLPEECKPHFTPSMMFGSVIGSFNTANHDEGGQDDAFRDAVDYAKVMIRNTTNSVFLASLDYIKSMENLLAYKVPAVDIIHVIKFESDPYTVPESVLEYTTVFRKSFVYWGMLNKTDPEREIHFIIVKKEEKDEWKVNTRSVGRFVTLTPLIDESVARSVLGSDLVFVHKKSFVGSTRSLPSALILCHLSMEQKKAEDSRSSLVGKSDRVISILAGCALLAMSVLLIRRYRA